MRSGLENPGHLRRGSGAWHWSGNGIHVHHAASPGLEADVREPDFGTLWAD
jgi:hypothetical protein